ncbi:MAG: helix-turn-helix domain-containing protein [Aquabacterium sp.]
MPTPTRRAAATRPDAAPQPPRIGERLAALRDRQALSLDDLSRRAGVSKSMLSQIERAQANPTVAVVWRLAQALGVALSDLLEDAPAASRAMVHVVPAQATPALQSGDGRWELRILGPIELAGRVEWYELRMQPGAEMRSQAHEPGTREHLTVVTGTLEVSAAAQSVRVKPGETARYAADLGHAIVNVGRHPATAWLVVEHSA